MPQTPKTAVLSVSPEQLEQAIAQGIRRGIGGALEEGLLAVVAIGLLGFGVVLRVLPLILAPQTATPPSSTITSTETLKIGDTVAGFTVTSDFGPRDAPATSQGQGSSDHQGVDVGTPSGTPLLAWDSATVECQSQPSGAGTYAEITVPSVADTVFVMMHMFECNAGSYTAGQEFGKTGGTPGEAGAGNSSGAHLHFGQKVKGVYIDPYRVYVEAILTGKLPATTEIGGDVQIVVLRKAIFGQESGDPNAVNASGSGAIGASQIMPENVAAWSKQCLGTEISADDLRGNLELQTQITDCKLKEYWDAAITASGGDEEIAVRRVAAQWYSGDPDLYQDTSPQSWAGDSYPSIADYTQGVLERYKTVKAESGGTATGTTTTATQPRTPSGLVVLASLVRSVISKGAAIPISAGYPIASSATPEQATFKMGSATGWKLNGGDLGMTAQHVIEPAPMGAGPSGTVTTNDGKSCRYTTIKEDRQLDLALLKLEGECATMPGLNLTTEIAVGDAITAAGYPQGGAFKINSGTIKALDTVSTRGDPDTEVSDQMLIAGMSGGPCSNSKGTFGVVSNGTNPQGQMRPGDKGWCAEIPEGWATEGSTGSTGSTGSPGATSPDLQFQQTQ